jgi:hypothetical protein
VPRGLAFGVEQEDEGLESRHGFYYRVLINFDRVRSALFKWEVLDLLFKWNIR